MEINPTAASTNNNNNSKKKPNKTIIIILNNNNKNISWKIVLILDCDGQERRGNAGVGTGIDDSAKWDYQVMARVPLGGFALRATG